MLDTLYKFIVGAPKPYSYSPVDKSNHSTPMAPQPQLDWDKVKNLLEASVILTRIALNEGTWSKDSGKSYATAVHEAAAPAIELLNQAAAEIGLYRDISLFEKFRETVSLISKELNKIKNERSEKVRKLSRYSNSISPEEISLQKKALDDFHTLKFRIEVGREIWLEAIGARLRCDPRKEQSKLFPNPEIKEHET